MKAFNELKDLSTKDLIDQRMDKYSKMGEYKVKSLSKKIRSPTVSDFF
jgi:pantoate kinase